MKTRFTQWSMVAALLIGALLNAQTDPQTGRVGINNSSPRATLDVQPSTENLTESATSNEGALLPQVSITRLAQIPDDKLVEGTIVYVNDVSYTGEYNVRISPIKEKGYYVFKDLQWLPLSIDPTGLEKITQNGNTGWRLIGVNSFSYIGDEAVDLSIHQNGFSPSKGATGQRSIATGYDNAASGDVSTAMGSSNIASGYVSTAMGINNIASGRTSTAIGLGNRASGDYSTAIGTFNIVSGEHSTALGQWNKDSKYNLFSVGAGINSIFRKNALVIDYDGRVAIGKDSTDLHYDAARFQVNVDAQFSDYLAVGKRTAYKNKYGAKLQVAGDAQTDGYLVVGKVLADRTAGAAKLQVAGAIQSDALKSSANTIVASNAKGELVHGGVSQADLVNMITEIKNIKSKAEQDNKHRLVPWDQIKNKTTRLVIHGTCGYWYWDLSQESWRYVGLVRPYLYSDNTSTMVKTSPEYQSLTFYLADRDFDRAVWIKGSKKGRPGIDNDTLEEIMSGDTRFAIMVLVKSRNGKNWIDWVDPEGILPAPVIIQTDIDEIGGVLPVDQLWYYDE